MLDNIIRAFTMRECMHETPMTRLARIEYNKEYEFIRKSLGRHPVECEVRHLVNQ